VSFEKQMTSKRKYLMDYKLGYMSLDIICSSKLLEEQISFSSFSETEASLFFFSNGSYCLYIFEPNGEVMHVD